MLMDIIMTLAVIFCMALLLFAIRITMLFDFTPVSLLLAILILVFVVIMIAGKKIINFSKYASILLKPVI